MALDIVSWILFATFMIIFLVFLFFDAFKRDEPYGNLSYIVAVFPTTYLWSAITQPANQAEYASFGAVGIWALLVILWFISMIRDMLLVRKKKKEADDVALYLIIGILVQLIISAVFPADGVIPDMQYGSSLAWLFWLPDLEFIGTSGAIGWFNILRIMATLLIILVAIPMIFDLKDTPQKMYVLVIITLIFSLPFALICWLWLPTAWAALLLMVSVLFFIALLMLTRGEGQK